MWYLIVSIPDICTLTYFFVAPIVCGDSVFGHCFVYKYFVFVSFCKHLYSEERAGGFALNVFLMSSDSP